MMNKIINLMIEVLKDNKGWFISALIALAGLIFAGIWRIRDKRAKRIQKFIDDFRNLYRNGGSKLEKLIPAGINILENDKEIEIALTSLANIFPSHPLRKRHDGVRKIGYKKFFAHVVKSGKELNKNSIETFIKELQQ